MFPYLASGFSLGFTAVASPGPFQAYLISQTFKNGWRRTLVACLAPLVSDGPIIALILYVLNRLSDGFVRGLQIAGGLLLFYFAWKAFQAFQRFDSNTSQGEDNRHQSLFEATLINMMSPGPWLFWSMISGPILIQGWRTSPVHGLAFLSSFYISLVGGLAGIIVLFGTARQLGPKISRALLGMSALVLLFFGFYQFVQGIVR